VGTSFIFPQVIKDKRCPSWPGEEVEQAGPKQLMSTILRCSLWRVEGDRTPTAPSSITTGLSSLPSLISHPMLGVKCSDHSFNQKFDASNLSTIIGKSLKEKQRGRGGIKYR